MPRNKNMWLRVEDSYIIYSLIPFIAPIFPIMVVVVLGTLRFLAVMEASSELGKVVDLDFMWKPEFGMLFLLCTLV